MLAVKFTLCPGTLTGTRVGSLPRVVAANLTHHRSLTLPAIWTKCQRSAPRMVQEIRRWPQRRRHLADLPLLCRSYAMEPVPADLRIEAKEEDGTSDIEYDEQNKVVRIPLSALGPEGQRRTKLVLFTCNKCGGRTARLVNPIAWDKGAVFAQCAKCGVWHVLSAPNKKIFEEVRYNQEEQQQQQ
ncbi:hypothetical protein Vretimale_5944 [Volvox reticuliferus]|uniref:DNL-type domain-containing protein n=2 Tax=Volvox reticuliferus TaxID=1737510 RepID=A0A8J4LL55_9CHLO|nr:hypothetical protein Vretimale_5944 [Volvox reticuliferus]